jgi:hypothetical protein
MSPSVAAVSAIVIAPIVSAACWITAHRRATASAVRRGALSSAVAGALVLLAGTLTVAAEVTDVSGLNAVPAAERAGVFAGRISVAINCGMVIALAAALPLITAIVLAVRARRLRDPVID